ncbi:MAG: hypothetical protein U5Q03_18630 [Bacteroidota bacterium]|nr:hypothetical protein [Bacteroidota bacterium]
MKKLLFSISLSSLCFLLPAQNQHFHRGSIPGELYIVSEFKDLDYMYCDIGLFHTNDHGKTLN